MNESLLYERFFFLDVFYYDIAVKYWCVLDLLWCDVRCHCFINPFIAREFVLLVQFL